MASTHRRGFIQGLVGAAAAAALSAVGKGKPEPDDAPIRGLRAWEDRRGLALVDRRKRHDKFDSARIQAAIDDAVERGLGGVLFSSRVYELNEPVRIPSVRGFLLQGVGGTTFQRTASGATRAAFIIAGSTGDLHEDIRFENLSFYGGMKNLEELGTRRARGQKNGRSASKGKAEVFWNEGTLRSAISVSGDLSSYWDANGDDAQNPHGIVRNITVDNCAFRGIAGLPVFFRGVRGKALLTNSYLLRCLDPGWVYCESAQFTTNRSEYSMDNGASLSRGCQHAIATGNSIHGAWYNGIWVGGFRQDQPKDGISVRPGPGPSRVVVTGNSLEDCGECGVYAADAIGQVSITGNTIFGIHPSSATSRSQGVGILASEWHRDDIPRAVTISGNTIENTARGGIICGQARVITVNGNTLRLIGSRTFPDGSTRDGGGGTQRVGIGYGAPGEISGSNAVSITGNTIADHRGTSAATRYAIHFPKGGKQLITNNLAVGCEYAMSSTDG